MTTLETVPAGWEEIEAQDLTVGDLFTWANEPGDELTVAECGKVFGIESVERANGRHLVSIQYAANRGVTMAANAIVYRPDACPGCNEAHAEGVAH